ncbi:hypothetical protein COE15_19915 [Bacillus cereus]|nr:hypothetical protein CN288_16095 [Bacillus sp. AFS023182]PGX96178.1 hypothetical protein COE15_19915 [Bacillus cereus]
MFQNNSDSIYSLSLLLMYMFQQNSTNYIVTSFSFQFGYIFVTVVLHHKRNTKKAIILASSAFLLFSSSS